MKTEKRWTFRLGAPLCAAALLMFNGCYEPLAHFRPAVVHQMVKTQGDGLTLEQQRNIRDILAGVFGKPDEPRVPLVKDVEVSTILDQDLVSIAAGKVDVDESGRPVGLYRRHCAHCHGVSGDGKGPTAPFLNPYPRDYRPGIFKFKSTPIGEQPTDEDLHRILTEGIAGTAMPSFRLLEENELRALVHYVKYLSIRGQVERRLIEDTNSERDEEELFIKLPQEKEQVAEMQQILTDVFERWARAPEVVVRPENPPSFDLENPDPQVIARGRELFFTTTANCFSCHGDTAVGDGELGNFDDWAKEFAGQSVAQMDPVKVHQFVELGALEPRPIIPRNLRQGVYRGGRRPIDLYWRIRNGIYGTPMPAAKMKKATDPAEVLALTEEDLWSLIAYVRSLPYEAVSRPPKELQNVGFTR